MSDEAGFRKASSDHAARLRAERAVMDNLGIGRSQARAALRDFDRNAAQAERVFNSTRATPYRPPLMPVSVEQVLPKQKIEVPVRGGNAEGANAGGGDEVPHIEVTVTGALNGVPATCVFYATAEPVEL